MDVVLLYLNAAYDIVCHKELRLKILHTQPSFQNDSLHYGDPKKIDNLHFVPEMNSEEDLCDRKIVPHKITFRSLACLISIQTTYGLITQNSLPMLMISQLRGPVIL